VDSVPDPLLFFSGSVGNRTRASGSVAKNSYAYISSNFIISGFPAKMFNELFSLIHAKCLAHLTFLIIFATEYQLLISSLCRLDFIARNDHDTHLRSPTEDS
jgi:hypothetical protein